MKKTLVIGNGLNRIGNDKVSWDNTLLYLCEKLNNEYKKYKSFKEIKYDDLKNINCPSKFEYIVNSINSIDADEDNYNKVKNIITEYLNDPKNKIDEDIAKELRQVGFYLFNYY